MLKPFFVCFYYMVINRYDSLTIRGGDNYIDIFLAKGHCNVGFLFNHMG